MARKLKCPICENVDAVSLNKGRKTYRCDNCTRIVRVISAPRKRKSTSKDRELSNG